MIPIYPARELPMEGVSSEMIGELINKPCRYATRESLVEDIIAHDTDIVITFGAGNIDACCEPLSAALNEKYPAQNA